MDGVEGHLGVVGARLHAQVPTGQGGFEGVVGEGGQVDQSSRAPSGQPEPVVEQAGAEPEGQGELGSGQV